jgi:hypothetical protein
MRPEPSTSTPLRLNGGFSPGQLENQDEQDVGEMTDSTDVDDSMQRILVPQVSSRMSTPAATLPELPRSTPIAGPSSGRPAGNRKGARSTQVNGKHTSRSLKSSEDAPNGSAMSKTRKDKDKAIQPAVKLYVCEGCFKYMVHPASYALHFVSDSDSIHLGNYNGGSWHYFSDLARSNTRQAGRSTKRVPTLFGKWTEKLKRYLSLVYIPHVPRFPLISCLTAVLPKPLSLWQAFHRPQIRVLRNVRLLVLRSDRRKTVF